MADGTDLTWGQLLEEANERLAAAGPSPRVDARRIVEQASGREGADHVLSLADPAPRRGVAAFDAMLARRAAGEPLQYVLGRWGFRTLDLMVDRRVLIPRPETEVVVGLALAAADRPGVVVDLGVGSGAIALAMAAETEGTEVWGVERSVDALAVARANLAGLAGRAATRVRLVEGSWFEPLPGDLRGRVDLVVTNPPYVAAGEVLPPEVARWEPVDALVAGPTGLEAIEAILAQAPAWLVAGGAVVSEIGATQGLAAAAQARIAGFGDVEVHPDLTGRDRVLVARP